MKTRILLMLLMLLLIASCTKKESSPLASGAVVKNPAVDSKLYGFVGDGPYAVVRADALPAYYDSFRKRLFDDGVVRWEERFDQSAFQAACTFNIRVTLTFQLA